MLQRDHFHDDSESPPRTRLPAAAQWRPRRRRALLLHPDVLDIVEQEFDLPASGAETVSGAGTKSSQHYQRDFAFGITHEPDKGRACRFLHAKAQEKGFRLQVHEIWDL